VERVLFSTKTFHYSDHLEAKATRAYSWCNSVFYSVEKATPFSTRKIPACLVELIIMTRHIARIFWGIKRGGEGETVLFLYWNSNYSSGQQI
jgi:hypothetical protein